MASQDLNSVSLSGRLVKEAELMYSTGGAAILKFSIANNRNKKEGNAWAPFAHYFECVMFGNFASAMQPYLVKGSQVVLSGLLQQQRWTTPEGQTRSKVGVVVKELMLVGKSGERKPQIVDSTDEDLPM